jgi:leader peptidase (prepilin peptidase)/N-methyltransferase
LPIKPEEIDIHRDTSAKGRAAVPGDGAPAGPERWLGAHQRLAPAWWAAAGVLAAALIAAGAVRFGLSAYLPAWCYLALVSAPLAVIDGTEQRLPDRLTLPSYPAGLILLGSGAALATAGGGGRFLTALAGMAAAALFYLLLALISPASIGLGDVKLAGVLGLYLGWFGIRAVFAGVLGGFVLAAVAGMVLIAARRATRKTHIPFGPFMLAGALAVILTPALAR